MHRAHDPGQTIRDIVPNQNDENIINDLKREMDNGVSRFSLVHGTQTNPNSDTWYDTDSFLLDQVKEVLNKLSESAIDDEIWGKIVIMERCKRVAKAYLRKTTIIIDGSEDEFDGRTLGFNHFENSTRDDYTKEIRAKIADGVILKMDFQGNIKGMARGATPIVCQGWKEPRNNCISDRLVRLHGKLNHVANEDEKAYKVFDMRKFKHYLERELHDALDARTLLLKTCMRMALVKDGGDMNRTPCWFAIVNLVALDMVKEKVPMIMSLLNGNTLPMSVKSPPPPQSQESLDAQTLTQIIAAAVSQANKTAPPTSSTPSNLSISPEQLAQIASTISIAQSNTLRTADLTTINKKDRISYTKKPYHCSTSSLDSSGEDSTTRRADVGVKSRTKRWGETATPSKPENTGETKIMEKNRPTRAANRPLLQDVIFTRSQSITSDYDSNKEHFDSGSWSSTQSRYKGGRSTSSSVVSDHELTVITRDEMKETSEMNDVPETTEDEDEENSALPSNSPPTPSFSPKVVPTLPRKDYHLSPKHHQQHLPPTSNFTFSPKFEGTPVWKSSTRYEEPRKEETTPPPPPLPNTPLPPGLPASSPAYNNNNAANFTRGPARRWKFTSVEHLNQQNLQITHSSTSSDKCSNNERSVDGLRATTLNQPQFITACNDTSTHRPSSPQPPTPPPAATLPSIEELNSLPPTTQLNCTIEDCDVLTTPTQQPTITTTTPSHSTTHNNNISQTHQVSIDHSATHNTAIVRQPSVATRRQQFESTVLAHFRGVNGT